MPSELVVVAEPEAVAFYRTALTKLLDAGIPFLVGGAYALRHYTGIVRETKDFDIFVRPADSQGVLGLLGAEGYHVERTFPHWLGKVHHGDHFIDVIYNSGNGLARVDDAWFDHAEPEEVLGLPLRLCPVEEMIWQKAYIQERERFDGADVAHLLRARGRDLDWPRLLDRFGPHYRVLLGHLVVFGFIYPGERAGVPGWVLDELMSYLRGEMARPVPEGRVCQGTLLSRSQYRVDVGDWGYQDARLPPLGDMTASELAVWNADIAP